MREVGTNPFIIGDEAFEGNWFYDFLKTHSDKVQCYLLNTGGVGEIRQKKNGNKIIKQSMRVEIPEMAAIIRGIIRKTVEWTQEPYFNTMVPKRVNGLQMDKFDLSKFYSQEQINVYADCLKKERIEWLRRFENLDPAIRNAIQA